MPLVPTWRAVSSDRRTQTPLDACAGAARRGRAPPRHRRTAPRRTPAARPPRPPPPRWTPRPAAQPGYRFRVGTLPRCPVGSAPDRLATAQAVAGVAQAVHIHHGLDRGQPAGRAPCATALPTQPLLHGAGAGCASQCARMMRSTPCLQSHCSGGLGYSLLPLERRRGCSHIACHAPPHLHGGGRRGRRRERGRGGGRGGARGGPRRARRGRGRRRRRRQRPRRCAVRRVARHLVNQLQATPAACARAATLTRVHAVSHWPVSGLALRACGSRGNQDVQAPRPEGAPA